MQLEFLKVFCDIARSRSFSEGAEVNGLSQSAGSQIVLYLEKRLGTQLVDRSTRPLQLTASGRAYYDGCKSLVEQYSELEASIRQAQAQLDTRVQIAAIYSVGLSDMGQYVERFAVLQPSARVHIDYLHPDAVYERVLDGTADFGLVSFPRRVRELVALPWRDEDMVLACAPGHTLAKLAAVAPAQLAGVAYVGFDKGLVIRRQVDRFLRDHGVTVDVKLEFDNIETIKKAVEVSTVVALLPEPTIRKEVEAGTLIAVPLAGCRLVRPLGVIYRRNPKPSSSARRFIDLLRESGATEMPPSSGMRVFRNGAGQSGKSSARGRTAGGRRRQKTG
jgi:DNA-binding transcriptional LysR family regulator